MDTLGPRIMVNVGTQAVSNTGVNPRDLAPLTNDAFLATFLGKTSLSASNGITRQSNNYRHSYTTQMERVTLRSKPRASTSNGESGEPDSAILSIIRGNGSDSQQQTQLPSSLSSQRQLQGNRNRRRSWNQPLLNGWNDVPCSPNYRPSNDLSRRRRTRSGGAQQQISVVDQMAAQPHIPYAILPKRFEPKQVASNGLQARSSNNNNNNNNNNWNGNARRNRGPNQSRRLPTRQPFYDDDQWLEEDNDNLWLEQVPSSLHRRYNPRLNSARSQQNGYYGQRQRFDDYYDSYAYGPSSRQGQIPFRSRGRLLYADDAYLPFNIVPAYDLNEWQGPYARARQTQAYGGARYRRNDNGFIRDDHRANGSSKQSRNGYKPLTPTRNGKQTKSPKNKGQQKRRNSRGRKTRNQNSKTEATTPSLTTTTTEKAKSTTENETETAKETKQEPTTTNESEQEQEQEQQPLPPRDQEQAHNGEQN